MSTRVKQSLLSLVLIVVLGVAGVAEACCGTEPNYSFIVEVIGTPDCNSGQDTGTVNWQITYKLPSMHKLNVHKYGDGVIQDGDYYATLPQVPTAHTNVMTGSSTWHWEPGSSNPRKVRVQFNVAWGPSLLHEEGSLIVFTCTARGPVNISVHNS